MKETIKEAFQRLLDNGIIKGQIGGPKENILICEAMHDWCVAGAELGNMGYSVLSPGGYLASIDADFGRKALDARVWRYGTVYATSYTKRGFLKHGELFYSDKYLDIISEGIEQN